MHPQTIAPLSVVNSARIISIVLATLLSVMPVRSAEVVTLTGAESKNAENAQQITNLKAARALMLERNENFRTYGNTNDEEYLSLSAKFKETVRKAGRSFPLLEARGPSATNRFFKLVLNQVGAGFDGFRFKNTSSEPKNFGWVFVFDRPGSMERWFVEPAEVQEWRGFSSLFELKHDYANAPWGVSNRTDLPRVQSIRDQSLLPGREYIIWFSFTDARPNTVHFAFELFPMTEKLSNRDVIEEALGLKGASVYPEFRNQAPAKAK